MKGVLAFLCVAGFGVLAFAQQYAGCPEEKAKKVWCPEAVVYCSQCPLENCGGIAGCNGSVLYEDFFSCEGNPGAETKCIQIVKSVIVVNPDGTVGETIQPVTAVCYRSFRCTQRRITYTNPETGQATSEMICLADLGTPNNNLPPVEKPIFKTSTCN